MTLAGASAPFFFNGLNFQVVTKKLFAFAKSAEDRVLVLIRLNGGNDGLGTVIPLDSYDNLANLRQNIIIPENNLLNLNSQMALHPSMPGMRDLFMNGKLSIIQNVGYPEQNRSHFRSMDIWNTGAMDPASTSGWLGKSFDVAYPNFPDDYPNSQHPDPFAISMGYEVSATCQGLMGNFSMAIQNPFDTINLGQSSASNDGTYHGAHMEYVSTLIAQSNSYGNQINTAANAGNSLSNLYDVNNPLAMQLKYVAQMISGGLETKVYILNLNGFDTHDSQVDQGNPQAGEHAYLLKTLSDAITAFQDDLNLLGLENRVAGMTYSEFGRQIKSNASNGTDHGDAAPLFLFGGCTSNSVIGNNPVIAAQVPNQAGLPMQIDFRDIYASVLKDWFGVSTTDIQSFFEHNVTYYPVLNGCNLGEDEIESGNVSALVFPNPAYNSATLRFESQHEQVAVRLIGLDGRIVRDVFNQKLSAMEHSILIDLQDIPAGQYIVVVDKLSGTLQLNLNHLK